MNNTPPTTDKDIITTILNQGSQVSDETDTKVDNEHRNDVMTKIERKREPPLNTKEELDKVREAKLVNVQKKIAGGMSRTRAMISEGFSESYSASSEITSTKSWQKVAEKFLPNEFLAGVHQGLLKSNKLDHMVFPLGPKGEDEINFSGARPDKNPEMPTNSDGTPIEERGERTTMTDKEIVAMLAETGCTVKRIVHGETARHVYFWSPDNNSRNKALDTAYKVKGNYAPEKKAIINLDVSVEAEVKALDSIKSFMGIE